jgi:hypothetical protein
MDSKNTDKQATEGGENKVPKFGFGKLGTGLKQPFILGSMGGLPKLGDKAAFDAFMEKNRGGNAFVGTEGPGIEKKPLFGGGGMFGNLAPLGGSKETPEISAAKALAGTSALNQEAQNDGKGLGSIFSSGMQDAMFDLTEE